jgi:hypothetical protein
MERVRLRRSAAGGSKRAQGHKEKDVNDNASAARLAPVLAAEPPLSPPPLSGGAPAQQPWSAPAEAAPVAAVAPAPAPASAAVAVAEPVAEPVRPMLPVESLLLRFRLISADQLADAMKEEAATGRPVADVVVERGWVSQDDMARLVEPDAAPAAPVAVAAPAAPQPVEPVAPAPAPAAEPAPAPVAAPAPAAAVPAPSVRFQILAHLTSGERIEIAGCDTAEEAQAAAREAMRRIREADRDWPLFGGRYVRPESIVSVDVGAQLG